MSPCRRGLRLSASCWLLVLASICAGWLPVRAASTPVTGEVEQAALAWVRAHAQALGVKRPQVEVVVLPAARRTPDCAGVPALRVDEPGPGQRFDRLQVAVRCEDGTESRFVVRAAVLAPVLVAREGIGAGQALDAGRVELAERDLAPIPDALLDLEHAGGRVSRRALRAGQVLRAGDLQGEPGVRRGQAVRIVASGNGFQVHIAGTALQDGAIGETVRVRNRSSGRTAKAQVLAAGVVGLQAPRQGVSRTTPR